MKKIVLLFISLHLAFWVFNYWSDSMDKRSFNDFLIYQSVMGIGFYANYFLLVPELFKRNKAWSYVLWAFVQVGSTFVIKLLGLFTFHPHFQAHDVLKVLGYSIYLSFYSGGISTALRLGYDWAVNVKQNKDLQLQNTTAKIQFMKSNINLPFIVETLSHMETLAQKDPSGIVDPLIQLSNILRYSTYDATAESIEVGKEVEIMEEYVGLVNKMELEYSLRLSVTNLKEATLTVPNLMIKIVSFWRQQLSPYISGEHLIQISSTESSSKLILPNDLRFDLASLLLHYPEMRSVFFQTRYFYASHHLIIEINAVNK